MPLELGFQANAGPLSQISVQILSMETAVHLMVGAYGWLKARHQADSLNAVLQARLASLAPISTFNMQNYTSMRRRHPLHGVVRQRSGDVTSVELPLGSSSEYGGTGQCCLYAIMTALLCFFDQKATVSILMEILPEYLLHYDQDDIHLSKEPGPMYSAIRSLVAAVAKEEMNSRATQSLRRAIDDLRLSLGSAPRCELPKNCDQREICAFMEWLAVPFSKRKHHLYPTRSLHVWALAEVLSCLGFEIDVCKTAVRTTEQYAAIFANDGEFHQMTVHFVPVSVGRTDPYVNRSTPYMDMPATSAVRIVPIRTIPFMDLGQHLRHDPELMDRLSEAFNFTFKHFRDDDSDKFSLDLSYHQRKALEAFNDSDLEFGRVSLVYQNLKRPVAKYIETSCPDCLSHRRDSLGEASFQRTCWSEQSPAHNLKGRLTFKVIYMAAAYSLACHYVEDERGLADLDTEIAYEPSQADGIAGFLALERPWQSWFMDHYYIFRPHSCDSDDLFIHLSQAMCAASVPDPNISKPSERYGCHTNGMTLLSKFLLDPLAPHSTHHFSLRFGQPVDLPVHNDLIISREKHVHLKRLSIKLPPTEPLKVHDIQYTDLVRWDLDPDWEDCEMDIHYKCRTEGITSLSIPLPVMKTSLENLRPSIRDEPCQDLVNHNGLSKGRQALLAEYEQRLSCYFVPYKSLRQQGYSRILLEPRRAIWRVGKPTVIILESFNDPVEQWLALHTECQSTSEIPYPHVRRILSPCLRCGLAAADTVKPLLDTVIILVIAPCSGLKRLVQFVLSCCV